MPQEPSASDPIVGGQVADVDIERFVAGGMGLGHLADGRVVLVEGGIPGDRLSATVTSVKKRLVMASVHTVGVSGPGRIVPPCPEVDAGCGGCDLQHVAASVQVDLKVEVVRDALRRIAKLPDVAVRPGDSLAPFGYRTTLRCAVEPGSGRLGFRQRRSHKTHVVDDCMVAHPLAAEVIRRSRFPDHREVTVRVGAATGDRMVVVPGGLAAYVVPGGVIVASMAPGQARAVAVHEVVGGRRFRVSAGSFFQARPDGAAALVEAVRRALGDFDPRVDRMVDLYGGVGLFTSVLGFQDGELVEMSASATSDATVNLADLGTRITTGDVTSWTPTDADLVVADPSRSGLGAGGVRAVVATGARSVALVSCDPASLARDVAMLDDAGYEPLGVEVVDMFPQTHHVEAVTGLRKRAR